MVGFNSVPNSGKWLDYLIKNNSRTLLFATREFLILFQSSDIDWVRQLHSQGGLPPQLHQGQAVHPVPGHQLGGGGGEDRDRQVLSPAQADCHLPGHTRGDLQPDLLLLNQVIFHF